MGELILRGVNSRHQNIELQRLIITRVHKGIVRRAMCWALHRCFRELGAQRVWLYIFDRMVAVRVHLDPCGADNGALRVLPRTHRSGRLSDSQIDAERRASDPLTCEADAGDVILMKPLLLHASSASERPAHRRVIHLEYAACQLPGGLAWAESTI